MGKSGGEIDEVVNAEARFGATTISMVASANFPHLNMDPRRSSTDGFGETLRALMGKRQNNANNVRTDMRCVLGVVDTCVVCSIVEVSSQILR